MTEPRTIEQHGSRIIAALERAWAAIQDQHPDVPDVVIVTGAGSNQKGTPEGYRLRGHHWPERWVLDGQDEQRAPELFIAGELLSAGGRAVVEVMLHEAAHALATRRGIKDTSAAGNRYHNKRFVALAAELGLRGPDVPGQDHRLVELHPHRPGRLRRLRRRGRRDRHGPAPVPGRPDQPRPAPAEAAEKRTRATTGRASQPSAADGGSAVECACQPEPRRIQLTPKQIEDGPIICAACAAPRSSHPGTAKATRRTGEQPACRSTAALRPSRPRPAPARTRSSARRTRARPRSRIP